MKTLRNSVRLIAAFALTTLTVTTFCAAGVGWGLSYPNPGQTPKGTASCEELAQYDAYYVAPNTEKTAYLTFDAGYENGYTAQILDTLKKTNTPAAFFLVGTYIKSNPGLIERMINEGHIVANHTMSHPDMSAISDLELFKAELTKTEDVYRQVTGKEMPKYYRPPRGEYNTENLKMAKQLGYKTVFWSLAYVDWNVDKQPTAEAAFSKLLPRAHPGMIPLLHSTSKTNAEILEELITKYHEMGYEFKSLDDIPAPEC